MPRMTKPKKPNNQLQEVLYHLLTRPVIDRKTMMLHGVLNLPEQISRLRYKHFVAISTTYTSVINKYNQVVEFGSYKLIDKAQARIKYDELTS